MTHKEAKQQLKEVRRKIKACLSGRQRIDYDLLATYHQALEQYDKRQRPGQVGHIDLANVIGTGFPPNYHSPRSRPENVDLTGLKGSRPLVPDYEPSPLAWQQWKLGVDYMHVLSSLKEKVMANKPVRFLCDQLVGLTVGDRLRMLPPTDTGVHQTFLEVTAIDHIVFLLQPVYYVSVILIANRPTEYATIQTGDKLFKV